MSSTIEIGPKTTVGELAELLLIPPTQLISELFKNGVAVTVNENIDFDTAQIIIDELKLDVKLKLLEDKMPERPKRVNEGALRPPVVAVMGHVDHGKTSLLDAIRGASVADREAGGITQHISAYQITHNDRLVTLLDTPGHEAFAALRQHGARLTDVAVIVIAADEGIKPQTLEALRFAQSAGVKLVIAANKMDKPGADINKLKQQLSENNLMPEDWGGDTIIMPVSAKTKEGLNELLDMVLLVADVEELKAPNSGPARGVIIEAHMETGRGPMATALVEEGDLKPGDFLTAGPAYAKVRNLEDSDGKPIKHAGPSTPVIITGFKILPNFGDEFQVSASGKFAKGQAAQAGISEQDKNSGTTNSSELLKLISHKSQHQDLNIIIKADVKGSLTSIVDSLKTLSTGEVAARVVGSGVGVITESDIHLAHSTGAIIYGFHVELPAHIKKLAQRDEVPVRQYKVIYELIDDVKNELSTLLTPEVTEQVLGQLIVKGIFRITKTETIAGGEVTKGKVAAPALARLYRAKELIADNIEVTGLQRGPQETKEVTQGEMCGFSLKTTSRLDIKEEDKLEFFVIQTKTRTL